MNEFLIGRVQQDSGWWYGIWHTVEYCTVGSQALLRETIFGEEDEKLMATSPRRTIIILKFIGEEKTVK